MLWLGCRKVERERNDKNILLFNLNEALIYVFQNIIYLAKRLFVCPICHSSSHLFLVNMATNWLGKKKFFATMCKKKWVYLGVSDHQFILFFEMPEILQKVPIG
jgi:hypothetical protein